MDARNEGGRHVHGTVPGRDHAWNRWAGLNPKALSQFALAASIALSLFVVYPLACGVIARAYKKRMAADAEAHAASNAAGSPGRVRKPPENPGSQDPPVAKE